MVVMCEKISNKNRHIPICRIFEAHSHESVSLDQSETHLRRFFLQIIEDHSHLQSRKQIFLKFQYIVIVLCLTSRPYNLLEVFYLVYIIYHSSNFLELFNSIEDVKSLKDVIFI